MVVLEREHRPGGILRQCIHDGFGLTRFGETLSGPEYAQRFVAQAEELGITCLTDTTVLSLEADRTVTASGPAGLKKLRGDAVILTMQNIQFQQKNASGKPCLGPLEAFDFRTRIKGGGRKRPPPGHKAPQCGAFPAFAEGAPFRHSQRF